MEDDGEINIKCIRNFNGAIFTIADSGEGIKVTPKEKIFEPFVSTKPSGHGIGLWITKRLIESIGGNIFVGETQDGSTEFRIEIPELRRDEDE